MTGRYPQRLPIGLVEPLVEGDNSVGLPAGHPTVASLVKAVGYDTALIGKWHLGFLPEHHPLAHGFDEFYGVLSGAVDYFTHKNQIGELDLHEGMVTTEQQGYITNLLTDRAVAYLKKKRSRPFYLSLHYTSPHWPWEGPADKAWSDSIDAKKVNFRDGGSRTVYGSMVRNLDDSVARVMRALRDGGHEENTLVVFTSDNGGERWSYNWPMSESKGSLHEGGIRVPGAIRWPGVIPPGSVSDRPIITMDWTATILATAAATADPELSARRHRPDAALARRWTRSVARVVLENARKKPPRARPLEVLARHERQFVRCRQRSRRGRRPNRTVSRARRAAQASMV